MSLCGAQASVKKIEQLVPKGRYGADKMYLGFSGQQHAIGLDLFENSSKGGGLLLFLRLMTLTFIICCFLFFFFFFLLVVVLRALGFIVIDFGLLENIT
jgi:hypothetical protein